ncbi:MAG: nucleoside-diphosphate sugar epimerase/dehydratase [Lachnospiraceae bacterium]|nr:nucleoside-diphosphate sugar epimerase/dehydratase [Lachnospiraceae bacterium]
MIDLFIAVSCSLLCCFAVCLLTSNTILPPTALVLSIVSLLAALPAFFIFKTFRHVIRHSTLTDLWRIGFAVAVKDVLTFFFFFLYSIQQGVDCKYLSFFIVLDTMLATIALVMVRMVMVKIYERFRSGGTPKSGKNLILIYGTSNLSVALVKRLSGSEKYQVVGFYVYGRDLDSYYLAGLPVYYFRHQADFDHFVPRKEINGILFARNEDAQSEKDRLIVYCGHAGVKTFIAPPINEVGNGPLLKHELRQIRIEDLLGREEIHINMKEVDVQFRGKTVLVTGAAGSIGSELCRQLATLGVKKLVLFDSAETPMHELRLELERTFPSLSFAPIVGDVRVKQRVNIIFDRYRPDIVFHAAAYKHVPLMEENPCEAVLVNVIGSRQVADMAVKYGVEMMIMISTDKAVNPTNVMGCSKRLAEIYVQSLGRAIQEGCLEGRTKFVTTRFGNVLGSNGSVIPHFRAQIERGGPVTVTHREVIRFFMTIPEACRLVMEAATLGNGNDIFVFEMGEAVKIADLAHRMIELAGYVPGKDIQIEYTGLRPGEKLYEEVLSNEENTIPTVHEKIRVAKVRDYVYDDILPAYSEFEQLSREVLIEDTVRLMKRVVPEFISKNSPRFEKLDAEKTEQGFPGQNTSVTV